VRRPLLLIALTLALATGACAKSSTVVLTVVEVNPDVPPLLLLSMTVTEDADPARMVSSAIRSLLLGDAADRPDPFPFPIELPISVDPSFAGAVTIRVDGLDWDTHAVVASGSTPAQVVPEQHTHASLTLAAVGTPPDTDGGAGN
jgi:hypothetical protein